MEARWICRTGLTSLELDLPEIPVTGAPTHAAGE